MFQIKPIPVGNIHDDTAEQIARKIDRRILPILCVVYGL